MKLARIIQIAAFFTCNLIFCQEKEVLITLNLENTTLREAMLQIENETEMKIFYSESWLNDAKINKSYIKLSLNDILTDLLKETTLNFFITDDNNIILTQNSLIYNQLPDDFFLREQDSAVEPSFELNDLPVTALLEKQPNTSNSIIETIIIGKQKADIENRQFKISGIITDSETGDPIPDVAILVNSINKGAITDTKGRYQLNLPAGRYIIEVRSLGIKNLTKRVILYNDGDLNFSLDNSLEELEEVVIETNVTKNIEDVKTGNSRINSEDSKNIPLVLGERNVLKVSTMLPGVSTAGEGASGYNVRGGKTDQNLILLDDAVIYNPSHFFGIFEALNPYAIKDVNIYKGSIPAEFGGRISSVFDINTITPSLKEFKADISLGPVTANAVFQVPLEEEKSGLMIGGRAAYSDWVLDLLNETDFENSQASFYDFVGRYSHRLNKNDEINVMAYYSTDKFSITSDSLYGYNNRLASIKWNHQFNDKNNGTLILANSQYRFNISYEDNVNDNFDQGFQIDETELKFKMNYAYNQQHKFKYGISGKLYSVLPGELIPNGENNLIEPIKIPKEQAFESSIFISDEFVLSEKLLLDMGFRYSFFSAIGPAAKRVYSDGNPKSDETVIDTINYSKNAIIKTYGGPEFRLSARYKIMSDLAIKVSFNNTYQYIHTLSNNTTVSPVDTWKLSDNFIKPQQAQQVSIGIYKNFAVNKFEVSLEGFYKKQKNILDFKTAANLNLNRNIETEVLQGDGKAYGAEFLFRKNTGDLTGWLGYTYSRSFFRLESEFPQEQVNDGEFFPSNFDKPHDLSLVLNYKFTRRISTSANFVYQTGRPVTFPVGNYEFNGGEFVLYSDRNQFRIPDYYRLDIGFNLEGNHKKNKVAHSFWSLSVYNVLSRNNPYSIFFINDSGEIEAYQSSIFNVPVPSITYNISF